jgi:glyoxylase I family protein
MNMLKGIHHVAIICSNYAVSKRFYSEVLGLQVIAENYRATSNSYKLDLALPDGGQIELFSFTNAPERMSYPEARGLRHLAFSVDEIEQCVSHLESFNIAVEAIRIDPYTQRKFTFFGDPDGLPIELYQRN